MEVITNKIVFILLVCFAIWLIVDQIRFTLYKGPIKRGVKIFQIPMTHEMQIFFKTLDGEIVEYNYFNLRSAFIKMNDKREFLIRGRYFTGAPIIGFVDLSAGNLHIEIRKSLPAIILSSILFLSIIGAPFIALFEWFNIKTQKKSIINFINDHVEKKI